MPTKKPHLRAAAEGEQAPKKADPKSIGEAADSGERELLVSLRTHLAREMDKGAVPAHALASVSAKIREYDREIRAIDSREKQEAEHRGSRSSDEAWEAV